MDIVIIKFGGTSLSNDENLGLAAQRTIDFIKQGKKVIAVLSAQGKTTDKLLYEAKNLSKLPNKRELDVLASVR